VDNIPSELLQLLGEREKEILTRFVNTIYLTGEYSENFLVNIFIPLPKEK
jgi:hypothetical protein